MSSINQNPYESGYQSSGNFVLSNFDVYSDRHERVAKAIDGLQSASGELQYLVVEFLTWDAGKRLLIPINLVQVDLPTQRLYVPSLNRQQVLDTPAYDRNPAVAQQRESAVGSGIPPMRPLESGAPLEAAAPLEGYRVVETVSAAGYTTPVAPVTSPSITSQPAQPHVEVPPTRPPAEFTQAQASPSFEVAPTRPSADVTQAEVIPLKEERLVVDKKKQKLGEVVVRKEVETEYIQVPVQREKLIVEQVGEEPKQLAEIDLTDESQLPHTSQREVQLPPLPKNDR